MIQQKLCFLSLCVKNQAQFLDFCYSYEIICTICFQQYSSIGGISSDLMNCSPLEYQIFVAHGHALRGQLGERGTCLHPRAEVVYYVS